MNDIAIVIPTRNRASLLQDLIKSLQNQTLLPTKIIVIDSSDIAMSTRDFEVNNFEIIYKHVAIKSSAQQKNIGIDLIGKEISYILFLDDDVVPSSDYIENLIENLKSENIIGVSGVAISQKNSSIRQIPDGIIGLFKRVFFLDSKRDGALLASGVNIPIRKLNGPIVYPDWLIGCSAWNYGKISDLRFQKDFFGQSLGEDVIYSAKAKLRGHLAVNPNIHLLHLESDLERPIGVDFWKMWVVNRYAMIGQLRNAKVNSICFHWANLGQFIILIAKTFLKKGHSTNASLGIIKGYLEIIAKKVSNQ